MSEIKPSLQDVLTQNRAEEIGYDVWRRFVVPPFYNRLDLKTARKPRIIIGGRGCGKTMLLRYLSHQSMFSPDRMNIPNDSLSHIGLYWRADTQFCNSMMLRGIHDDIWHSAFNHFAALAIGLEVLNSLASIAKNKFESFNEKDIERIDFTRLQAFDKTLPLSAKELYKKIEDLLWEFQTWVSNVRKKEEPQFMPGRNFVLAMISIIQTQVSVLSGTTFFVYFDEYENLCEYQKRIINTWLKHSEVPLIFNIAMKKNSFDIKQTVGPESLSDIHDYREHDLEAYMLDYNFPLFAAEILFLQLSFINICDLPINIDDLRNPDKLVDRRKKEYVEKVLSYAQKLFPDVAQKDIARAVFKDKVLSKKLEKRIKQALDYRGSRIEVNRFFRKELPEASIVSVALLYRNRLKSEEIANEMDRLSQGDDNRFTGRTGWIHNNFIGCLLPLYAPYSQACPFYAGFRTFCSLSRGNVRHLLELCHTSLQIANKEYNNLNLPVDVNKQAEAAGKASAHFLGEVRSFGPLGNQLYTFVFRLGSLFELAQRRLTQSEPEVSHFSIRRGDGEWTDQDQKFLSEAVKWSVLFENIEDTKKKDINQPQSVEYILNPIYAPYFHISYRKKRKLDLFTGDVICLIKGSLDEYSQLMRLYTQNWLVESSIVAPSLFSRLEEECDEDPDAGK